MAWDSAKPVGTDLLTNSHAQIRANWLALMQGWLDVGEAWSYASASTITVPTDATTKYSVGMRVKITQATGGTKYFRISIVAATLLTLESPLGSVVANEAISSPCISPMFQPLGYPEILSVIFSYRTTGYNIAATNTWYTIGFDGTGVSKNITKADLTPSYPTNAGETTNNKFTVSRSGKYKIHYRITFVRTGTSGNIVTARLILNDTAEIVGSHTPSSTGNTLAQTGFTIHDSGEITKELTAGDFLSVQVGTDSVDLDVGVYTGGADPNPTTEITATINIERVQD